MTFLLEHAGTALEYSFDMFWDVLWPLALGFLVSAVVEAVVPTEAVSRALGRDSTRAAATAGALGAASSSCSYASVAVARTLFRKGATFANSIIFEFASTNLVVELGLVLFLLLGWQFLVGELSGGLVMIVLLVVIFRLTLRRGLVEGARAQAEKGVLGKMEGHAAMDMSVHGGRWYRRLLSVRGFTAVAHLFYMNVASLWADLVLGFLISGALAAWVPDAVWQHLFLTGHGALSDVWGALVGPFVSLISFVCSIGNVPLAAALWRGGISFGGVIAFIFADLIIIPILSIYRRYYGGRMALYLLVVSWATMSAAGLIIGGAFNAVGIAPTDRHVTAFQNHPGLDATSVLNGLFLVTAAVLGFRFLTTGGVAMLRMMGAAPDDHGRHGGDHEHEGAHRPA